MNISGASSFGQLMICNSGFWTIDDISEANLFIIVAFVLFLVDQNRIFVVDD